MPSNSRHGSAEIPQALRAQMREAFAAVPETETSPERLAAAALDRLRLVLATEGDRKAALDLLAADALLTQACEAAAEEGPESLREFAQLLLGQITGLLPQQEAEAAAARPAGTSSGTEGAP